MSLATIRSFAFSGIEAVPVSVQVQISSGLPAFLVVGLPDKAVGEARERVRAALTAMGLALPPRRVLVNLAPADLLKEGSHFDLPLAIAVLAAMDVLPREEAGRYAALGELSLDGSLNPVSGVLPAAIAAAEAELGLICPESQGGEAAWAGGVDILAPRDLLSLINHFRGAQILSPPAQSGFAQAEAAPDLADVKGMESARRALEIAAAGAHNLLQLFTIDPYGRWRPASLGLVFGDTGPSLVALHSHGIGLSRVCLGCGIGTVLDLGRASGSDLSSLTVGALRLPCPLCGKKDRERCSFPRQGLEGWPLRHACPGGRGAVNLLRKRLTVHHDAMEGSHPQ